MFTVNTTLFNKQLNNLMDYSFGFLEGIQAGKKIFLPKLATLRSVLGI